MIQHCKVSAAGINTTEKALSRCLQLPTGHCCAGRQIGLRADRDADGHSSRDDRSRDDRSSRRDTDYRSRRDDSYRSSRDDRGDRRDRSPGRGEYSRDRGQDRHRSDRDQRDDREPRRREARSGKSAEELDAEMDALKQQVNCCLSSIVLGVAPCSWYCSVVFLVVVTLVAVLIWSFSPGAEHVFAV